MHPALYYTLVTAGLVMVYQFLLLNYISITLHRSIAHRAFTLPQWWSLAITAVANMFTMYTNPRVWVAEHRLHHANSDDENDPDKHPAMGFWRYLWHAIAHNPSANDPKIVQVSRDKIFETQTMRFFSSRAGKVFCEITGVTLPLLAFYPHLLAAFAFWLGIRIGGLAVKSLQSYFAHCAHAGWGYRNYEIPDRSANINHPIASWASAGECLQNNHHAKPTLPIHAHRPGEWDAGFYMVGVLERLGIARLPHGKRAADFLPREAAPAAAVEAVVAGMEKW